MMKKLVALIISLIFIKCTAPHAPKKMEIIPSNDQLAWHKMGFYGQIQFNLNTFTNRDIGYGDENPRLFNPADVDCRQWVETCKAAGMKGIIFTAKDHDGFCLWPTQTTEYSIRQSPWKEGKGDILKELQTACDASGLKLGVYLSSWDRNNPQYGTKAYFETYKKQLEELLTNYGELFEIILDDPQNGTGYYGGAREKRRVERDYFKWEEILQLIRKHQPHAIISSTKGIDIQNHKDLDPYLEPNYSNISKTNNRWQPNEIITSIRPSWFYHSIEDNKLKSIPRLINIYYQSVENNGALMLSVPINKEGHISDIDQTTLKEIGKHIAKEEAIRFTLKPSKATATNVRGEAFSTTHLLDNDIDTYWATEDSIHQASVVLDFDKTIEFNRVLLQENISFGQRIEKFNIEIWSNNRWNKVEQKTTIGYKKTLLLSHLSTTKIRLNILKSNGPIVLSTFMAYQAPELLLPPQIFRTQDGNVYIIGPDQESKIYYTTDGSIPTKNSEIYDGPFILEKPSTINAMVVDEQTQEQGPTAIRRFDIAPTNWKQVGNNVLGFKNMLNGQDHNYAQILDIHKGLIIDLGSQYTIQGFSYLPIQDIRSFNFISEYQFFVSKDGKYWGKPILKGNFKNIRSFPVKQVRSGALKKGRYIKLVPIKTTDHQNMVAIAGLEILTKQ